MSILGLLSLCPRSLPVRGSILICACITSGLTDLCGSFFCLSKSLIRFTFRLARLRIKVMYSIQKVHFSRLYFCGTYIVYCGTTKADRSKVFQTCFKSFFETRCSSFLSFPLPLFSLWFPVQCSFSIKCFYMFSLSSQVGSANLKQNQCTM